MKVAGVDTVDVDGKTYLSQADVVYVLTSMALKMALKGWNDHAKAWKVIANFFNGLPTDA